jgi:hypothetical protein
LLRRWWWFGGFTGALLLLHRQRTRLSWIRLAQGSIYSP